MNLLHIAKFLKEFMSVPRDNPELMRAQYKAFSKQIPLMYAILIANTWTLSYDFIGAAPDWLAIYLPIVFSIVCLARLISWWIAAGEDPSDRVAYRALARTNRLAGVIATAFVLWSIALYPYGTPFAQAHVAFYMAISVIGVIFCLMHLRPAAFTVALIVNVVFIGFFGLSEIPSLVATAVNILLVSVAMLIILMVYYRDFTEMVAAKAENFRLANVDALTELPNRRHFFDRLGKAFRETRQSSENLVVGILDLDGFKPVNDLYGHAAGDELLIKVGRRLRTVCEGRAFVARLGGDEFALIARDLSEADCRKLGKDICSSLRKHVDLKEVVVEVTATVGFATHHAGDVESEQELFERADYALYKGKRNRRGGVVMFSAEHQKQIDKATRTEKALRSADLEKELSVLFQPIVNMRTGEPVAFEALARWNSPNVGPVPPGLFIPVAERAGFVHRLTEVLFAKALDGAAQWPPHIHLSFNLSAQDISNKNCAQWLSQMVTDSSIDPTRIDFEITETAVMHDSEQALATIEALRARGHGISLDDFGTGYSSLSQLHSLPLTKIKIDRSFVTNLHDNEASYKIVQSMLKLSGDMGLDCIVEGVETPAEAAVLEKLGCSLVQGFRFSRPLTAPAALAFLSHSYGGAGDTPTYDAQPSAHGHQ